MPETAVIDFETDQRSIVEHLDALPRPLEVLEAGCGRRWPLDLQGPFRLTGIDEDRHALEARQQIEGDLDHAIVGDIVTADLPAETYDVIYCSFVLEHVEGAEATLDNFHRWLRPGGVIVIKVPDRSSLYGLAARLTPFRFHVWVYRRIHGIQEAGTLGHGPYPTVYEPVISREGFEAYCRRKGLRLTQTNLVNNYMRGNRLISTAARILGLLTLNRIPWRWNDLTYIVHKPAA